MKLIATIATMIALLLGGAVTGAESASATEWESKPGPLAKCVTGVEMRQLEGLSRADAEKVLDGPGYRARLWSGARDYRPCGLAWEHGRLTVHYGKAGRVWYASRITFHGGSLDLPIGHPARTA